MREALQAFRSKMRAGQIEDWRFASLIWAARTAFASKPPKPPKPPQFLREADHGGA